MRKNIVQDVVPPNARSIRRIPLPNQPAAREPERIVRETITYREEKDADESETEVRYSHSEESVAHTEEIPGRSWPRIIIWGIGIVSVIVAGTVFAGLFNGAELSVVLRTETVPVNLSLTAKPNAVTGELAYTPFSLTKEKQVAIASDGEKHVEYAATGRILIYNNYSTAVQRLVKNTRFETPDGLIFKIKDSVTIPGRKTVAGAVVPGSIEAEVFAESPGEEYNIGLTDFTIPGFKSSPDRYKAFYARSKTAMTGGKIGTVKSVSDQKMFEAKARLEADLKASLIAEAVTNTPTDSVFYDGAYKIDFEVLSGADTASKNEVTVRERARFTAFFMKREDVAQAIAKETVDNFDKAPVTLAPASKLDFSLTDKGGTSSVGPISFTLKGTADITWKLDEAKLSAELFGKNKAELGLVVGHFPAITSASAVIRPFWKNTFPTSADKIKIKSI